MIPQPALERAGRRLVVRLAELEARLDVGADEATWRDYTSASAALAAVLEQLAPERRGRLLTTAELGERLGVSNKTIHRMRRDGRLSPAMQNGKRGPGAFRWRATEAAR